MIVADGWYAIGPALVIARLADRPRPRGRRRRPAARARRAVRVRHRRLERCASTSAPGSRPPSCSRVLALVYLIDALLAPIGYLAARRHRDRLLRLPAGDRARRPARPDRPRAQHPDRPRARPRTRVPAQHAGARRPRRGAAPPRRALSAGRTPRGPRRLERILLATTRRGAAGRRRPPERDRRRRRVRGPALDRRPRAAALAAAELDARRASGATRWRSASATATCSRSCATQRPFDAVERDLLEHLAAQAAVSLENLRLEELLAQRRAAVRRGERAHRPHAPAVAAPARAAGDPGRGDRRAVPADRRGQSRSAATSTTSSRPARSEWFAVIGDVCGKGPEAAAVTALARYTIRAAVMRHRSPAGILRWLNAAMIRQGANRFVTLACARIERRGRRDRHRRLRRPPAAADPARDRAGRDDRRQRHAARRPRRRRGRSTTAPGSIPATRSCSTPTG